LCRLGTRQAELDGAALRERAGEAAGIGGDLAAATAHYGAAADAYREHELIRDSARANARKGRSLEQQGRQEEARTVLEDALAVLEVESDADTVDALDALAVLHNFSGNWAAADRLSTEALALAQDLGLPDAKLAALLVHKGIADAIGSRPVQAVASLREAVRRAEAASDGRSAALALANLADVLMATDPVDAAHVSRDAVAHCRRVGYRYVLIVAAGNLIQALMLLGDWDEARHLFAVGSQQDQLKGDILFDLMGVLLTALSGDRTSLGPLISGLPPSDGIEDPQELACLALARAAAAATDARHAIALDEARGAISHGEAHGLSTETIRWGWPLAADAALGLGDLAEVDRLLDWLEGHPPGRIPPMLRAERLRIRARLLTALGDPAAGPAFEAAIQSLRSLGSPYHLAAALLHFAEYIEARGDHSAAAELAAEAGALASQLGAAPLLEGAQRLAASVFIEPRPIQSSQVADLLA
jgi:tetratricopeptide (TPR) repeat protein